MIANCELPRMNPQEYLEWEEQQPIKYEYVNGFVFAMTGGTLPHNDIALNLASALKTHLRDKGCKVQMVDVKLGVSKSGPFHYPDVMVSCDSRDKAARLVMYYPCLIIEVLSPSTEGFDRGDKFKHYRRIKTLKEYVLISQEKMSVECYRLNERSQWELTPYSVDESTTEGTEIEVYFTSVDFRCPISLIYENVELPAPSSNAAEA